MLLNAEGGHPGNDAQHAAIRRWIAPRDGAVTIEGELQHPSDNGDGVRGRIVSNRKGLLGEWIAFHQQTNTSVRRLEVKRGDTVDFINDCRNTVDYDSFNWAPVLHYISEAAKNPAEPGRRRGNESLISTSKMIDEPKEWNAKTDFSGPPKPKPKTLGPWEKYAQVLLLANELVFVD